MNNQLTYAPIGEYIQQWREYRNLTPAQLARTAGVTKGYISRLENLEVTHPQYSTLNKLATALNISVDDIYHRIPPSAKTVPMQSVGIKITQKITEAIPPEDQGLVVAEVEKYLDQIIERYISEGGEVSGK